MQTLENTPALVHAGPFANPVGRWEEGRCPVTTTQIKEWLQTRNTTVIVRPVIDLAGHLPVGAYEIPDRHKAGVALRDHTCRFPWCQRPAAACDIDHAQPYGEGGVTCPCNIAALLVHHRGCTARDAGAVRVQLGPPSVRSSSAVSGRDGGHDDRPRHSSDPPTRRRAESL